VKDKQLKELILQSLEHERGGVQVYETALTCAKHKDLREEWQEYVEQTRTHVEILQSVCE
jgi:rubrerythrin